MIILSKHFGRRWRVLNVNDMVRITTTVGRNECIFDYSYPYVQMHISIVHLYVHYYIAFYIFYSFYYVHLAYYVGSKLLYGYLLYRWNLSIYQIRNEHCPSPRNSKITVQEILKLKFSTITREKSRNKKFRKTAF